MKHSKRCRGQKTHLTDLKAASHGLMLHRVCVTCGAWISLGPSDEKPVIEEVRAADLGDAGFGDRRPIAKRREEVDGLIAYERDRDGASELASRPMWHAGWLAGAILFHDREQVSA